MKGIKRVIAWVCQLLFGEVRWWCFLVKVNNITKNSLYDKLTEAVMRRVLRPTSVCVDVGCNKGDLLGLMMQYAPEGEFFAFEPLPDHYKYLADTFKSARVHLYNLALSDSAGTSSFNYVVSNPAYSGLKKRPYDRPHEEDRQIEVRTDRLDHVLKSAAANSVDLIKIDVEGGEYLVLKGAIECIQASQPVVIFEHGPGSAQAYGFSSGELFDLLNGSMGLDVSLLQDWLLGKPPLTREAFIQQVTEQINYYFMAHKKG